MSVMILHNSRYEMIFAPENFDQDCDRNCWEDEHYCYIEDKYSPGGYPYPVVFLNGVDYKGFLQCASR